MAVPKRKMSRSNTRARRSQWKAKPIDLVPIMHNGQELKVPRRLVKAIQLGIVNPQDLT